MKRSEPFRVLQFTESGVWGFFNGHNRVFFLRFAVETEVKRGG